MAKRKRYYVESGCGYAETDYDVVRRSFDDCEDRKVCRCVRKAEAKWICAALNAAEEAKR